MPCGLSCSMAERRPPLDHTWNKDCGSITPSGTVPMQEAMADTTLGCVAAWSQHHPFGLGYPDQAVVSSQSSLELAQQLDHPFSLTIALVFAAMLHHCRREAPLTQARTETAITLAVEQNFPQQLERARSLRGWALAACGHVEEGIAQIHQGLASAQSIGATRDQSYNLALLAEARRGGADHEGLEASAEALDVLGKSGVRWWEAELYRLKGELLLQRSEAPQDEIESCLIKRSPWPEPSRRSLSNCAQP